MRGHLKIEFVLHFYTSLNTFHRLLKENFSFTSGIQFNVAMLKCGQIFQFLNCFSIFPGQQTIRYHLQDQTKVTQMRWKILCIINKISSWLKF